MKNKEVVEKKPKKSYGYNYNETSQNATMEEVINNVDLIMELVWKWREIREIRNEITLEINANEEIQKELNDKLESAKKLYYIYLKEIYRRELLPEQQII